MPAAALLAASLQAVAAGPSDAPSVAPGGSGLRPGGAKAPLPSVLEAEQISGRADGETVATGAAEFRRGDLKIRADELRYDQSSDQATARGDVRIDTGDGNRYSGPELQLQVQDFSGYFLSPTFFFGQLGAGGTASRVDFIDSQRAIGFDATYTSCPADGSGDPPWLLSSSSVKLDFAKNEGVAKGAMLRFYGVPILAAPVISFPLTDARKSGWLPPLVTVDNRSGLQVAPPFYWNIAPNRDATLTPTISARRGPGLNVEYRYLEPRYTGVARVALLPRDYVTGSSRYSLDLMHTGERPNQTAVGVRVLRVSDDAYWRDFPREVRSLTPRLLLSDAKASRPWGDWQTYARVMSWQVLQTADPAEAIVAPYERRPQLGARTRRPLAGGFIADFEGEFNHFANPEGVLPGSRQSGLRLHGLGAISRPFGAPGWTITPRLAFNAASYSLDLPTADGRRSATRVIPTFSIDSAAVFERSARWFGHAVTQTLEPRVLYVNTPYSDQSLLPNFDAAGRDFNFDSIFTPNAFSGVDRVSDSHQVTAGVTTRLLDANTGAEKSRFGIAQRFLLREQRVTPAGVPLQQRASDLLLLASTSLVPRWYLDASLQYSPDVGRPARSVLRARYSPGPYRTLNATYRYSRDLSEQLELGWQWPLHGPELAVRRATRFEDEPTPRTQSTECEGTWYGVGRANYSVRERRLTDSLVGFEYDAGCWVGRVVAERLSTGRTAATTRLMVQLELVGLSRLGSSPLQTLKDNIPGYRLLREPSASSAPTQTP